MSRAATQAPSVQEDRLAPFRFGHIDHGKVLHGIAGRHGGVSDPPFSSLNLSVKSGDDPAHVEENRRRFERLMRFETRQSVLGRLSHGRNITVFRILSILPPIAPPELGWPMFDSDAAISNVPGLVMIMTFADCVPILLWDPANEACGLVHAGWRGTVQRIASATIQQMVNAFGSDPTEIVAGIGPSICVDCYPVSEEVRAGFDQAYGSDATQFFAGNRLDLWRANRHDLTSAGVREGNIATSGMCTACNTETYFSHRAENGSTGRFGACIGIRYPGRFIAP